MHRLEDVERVEADKGYRGASGKVDLPHECLGRSNPIKQRRSKALVRARHETLNKRLKQFNCLKMIFRHDLSKHKTTFKAVCVITQYTLECGNPLFRISGYKTKNDKACNKDEYMN